MRALLTFLAISSCWAADIQRINPDGLPKPTRYSHVAIAKGEKLIYVAGQIGADATGKIVGKGDIAAQAEQALKNVQTALASAGATFADVIKMNFYVVGLKPGVMSSIRSARDKYIKGDYPAGTAVGVQSLISEDALIEIEVVAVK